MGKLLQGLVEGKFEAWTILAITMGSAAIMQMLTVHKNFEGTRAFLAKFFPNASQTLARMARLYGVSQPTISRILAAHRLLLPDGEVIVREHG
jgi:hypothetical protein